MTEPDNTHECPKLGCEKRIPPDMLACRPHWYSVPKPLRAAVWRAWNYGHGAGTNEHNAAIRAAINAMNRAA